MSLRFPSALLAALALLACDHPLPAPTAPDGLARGRQAEPSPADAAVLDRFAITLSARGPMRPGVPIHLDTRVTAALSTAEARIEITLPDAEAARMGGRPRLGEQLRAEREWRGGLAAGQAVDVGAVVRIPEPGYYRVVATAVRLSGEPDTAGGMPVRSVAVRELWLLVDETRGSVRAERRLADLPDTVERAPGPYRRRAGHARRGGTMPARGPSARRASHGAASASVSPGNPRGWFQGAPGSYNEIAVSAGYYHPIERRFVYAAGVPVRAEVWRRDQTGDWPLGGLEPDTWTITGANLFPCSPNDPDEYLVFRAELSSWAVWMPDADPSDEVVATNRECGLEYFFLETDAPHTRIFLNLSRSAEVAWSMFGRTRPALEAVITASPWATGSRYTAGLTSGERIMIAERDIWDDYGTFIQAHEYGHAFHQKAWGGITGGCSGTHALDQPSSLGCAYSEGIADFFSFVTLPDTWVARMFSGVTAASGTDRSTTEAYVASFLTRLVDPADPARPWDRAHYPGRYVGETIRTCTTNGVLPARADGIDRLIYCLEREVDPVVRGEYFPARTDAWRITAQGSSAPVPAHWRKIDVRTAWERVLYGQEWTRFP